MASRKLPECSRRQFLQATTLLSMAAVLPVRANTPWRESVPLPMRVQEIYPCLHNGRLWVAGGLSPDAGTGRIGITDRVFSFDAAHNHWAAEASLPEPRHHGFLVSVAGELLLFSGFIAANGGSWSASKDILRFNDGNWSKIGKLPDAQTETVAAVADGRIHFAGGRTPAGGSNADWGDQTDVATHQVFNPATNETTTAAPLPMARNSAAAFVLEKQWHVIGGRTVGGGNTARHDVYDFAEDRWREAAPLPQAQGGLAAASLGPHGYVLGGEYFSPEGGGVYAEVWQYDGITERWQDAGTMPVPRHGLGAVTAGDKIYVIAGATAAGGNGTSALMSIFTP